MAERKALRAHVVPHTHWDREWRYPIWKNRMALVGFLDQLLDVLEGDPAYRCFVLDGQSVAIEDYLDVRPENEARVAEQVRSGRLAIGPWYTLPDLYPVDGECLVRNLLKGVRLCARYGGHLGVGYNSFGWGQTAQLPQIYRSFGLDFLIVGKHVSKRRAPKCEFIWEGPDGSRLLATRLGEYARANLYFHAYLPIRFGVDYVRGDYKYSWPNSGRVIHNASPDRCHEDYFKLDGGDEVHADRAGPGFQAAWDAMGATAAPDCRLLMAGSDFTDCQPLLTRMLRDANAQFDDIEFVHSTLEQYVEELRERIDEDALPVVRGELRDGPASACSGNALATRAYLKILNKTAQNALLRRAEPVASALAMLGAEYPARMLETAWKYLLQSHAHDSINGVTQDKTAEDTAHRLRQGLEIAEVVHEKSIADLAGRIDLSSYGQEDILLLAVNPLARPVDAVLKLCVDTPREQAVWNFALEDAGGKTFDVQPVSREERTCPVNDMAARPWPFDHDRHIVYADLGRLPAGGYKVFKVRPTATFDRRTEWWPQPRTSPGGEISPSPQTLENEHLRVTVKADGTFDLLDKARGRTYAGLHRFEDAGDVGDYWVYYPPYQDQVHTSTGGPARVWREENGPLAATLGIEITMTLPAHGHRPERGVKGQSRRSDETTKLRITSRLTLRRGARRLEVRTVVDNTVEDHRLRVLFPTDLQASHSDASGHFVTDRRPIEPAREPDGAFWPDMQTHPQQHFVDISDGEAGLAVLNRCFTEYEVLRDGRATIAMTLFRSVRNRICTEFLSTGAFPMQTGGQCLRTMQFDYALFPHAGDWAGGGVWAEADELNAEPTVYQTSAHEAGELPQAHSLFAVEPRGLVLSAFKKAEDRDSFVLRAFNPGPGAASGAVRLAVPVASAWRLNLNEERIEPLPVAPDGAVRLDLPACGIVTVELSPAT